MENERILASNGVVEVLEYQCGCLALSYDNIILKIPRDSIINISIMLEEFRLQRTAPLFTLAIGNNVLIAVKIEDFELFNSAVQEAVSEMMGIYSLLSSKSA